ncbi:glycosyltransferase [Mycobacterium sp. Root265]|uniref:glycosyltransferase n=1 Tax=Mycobacterium sp. Root265 TaxID=1736504 RepID=UPI0009E80653|nr:glycosyltransferase [Mycobacterium sp. Root265]
MRIAVIGPARHPVAEPYAGGQERFTAILIRGLRDRGHDIELWARAGTTPALADDLHVMPDTPDLSTIASDDPNMPEPDFLDDQVAYLAAIRDLLNRNDIDAVLNQSLHQLPLALSSALRVPMITTLHTPPFPWMEIGAWLAGPASHLVAVSAALRDQWETLRGVRVIHNGVDPARFPVGPGGEDLAWAGRLTPEKGADIAIAAAARSGRRLRLAGPVSDIGWFDGVIRPMLGSRVEYVGALGDDELAEFYGHSAATLVTPRWEEPFCLVAAESQMCGTPVVGLRRGGLAEVVMLPGGVLVAAGDGESDRLAAALDSVLRTDRDRIGISARVRLSSDRTVDGYEQLLTLARRTNGLEVSR